MLKYLTSLPSKLNYLTKSNYQHFTSYKLTYGQGGQCHINLKNPFNNYKIQFQTIWQDYCNIQFKNDQQRGYVHIQQIGNKAILTDSNLYQVNNKNQPFKNILIKFQIPEDFTFYGQINGSIAHKKNNVSSKLRCNATNIQLLNKNNIFQWGHIQSLNLDIQVLNGAIDIKNLTFQNGKFRSHSFSSAKVLFSDRFDLLATNNINIRSIVAYGKAAAKIRSKYIDIQSISGSFDIQAQKVKIDRIWGSPDGIKIKTKRIQKIGIQTGTGTIQSEQPINQQLITFGRLHKGKKTKHGNKLLIIE